MSSLDSLTRQFAMPELLSFSQSAEGAVVIEVENDFSSAAISLSGGHLLRWQPKNQEQPVIWLSEEAKIKPGKSIRGGVPVCWPWFGAHKNQADFPAHGYARTANWRVIETAALANGETEIELGLDESDHSESLWPYATPLSLRITIGQRLKMSLTTRNDSTETVEISEALHTYFQIGDIAAVTVEGLDACHYLDKVDGFAQKTQAGAIGFTGETDRVYVDTESECVIDDEQLQRRIHIAKRGSASTVVWSPWQDKAAAMGDLGEPDGWRGMVCVESANAAHNEVSIAPGESHSLAVEYWVEDK